MKQVFFFGVFLLGLSLSSCTNISDDDSSSSNISPDATSETLVQVGEWRVSYFYDKDKDETSDFNSYTFRFNDDGTMEAVQGTSTVTGTWKEINDDGFRKLVIAIGVTKPLSELNDDWIIEERTDVVIKLRDDNDEHLEALHFSAL
ncbi:MAG TPA: hypothetical protein PKA00_20260 [Saprospiraceae bacterium]|nr:hypothetical protein [Saprospiraceae bacterium]HMQ85255.1 hypothetical protein [Saprospiraceae bacterium]